MINRSRCYRKEYVIKYILCIKNFGYKIDEKYVVCNNVVSLIVDIVFEF